MMSEFLTTVFDAIFHARDFSCAVFGQTYGRHRSIQPHERKKNLCYPGYNPVSERHDFFERIRSQFYILMNLCTEKIKVKSAKYFITFPCGFGAKNEEGESKTAQKMARVKE